MTAANDLSKMMTPTEFARKHHINRFNVYFWMKTYGFGTKEGRFWYLSEDEQKEMLQLNEARPDGKKYVKNHSSKSNRVHATESVESLIANLRIDEDKAVQLRYLMDTDLTSDFMALFEKIGTWDEKYKNLFSHERTLVLVALLLDADGLAQLSIRDGYPQYKLVKPRGEEEYTVVYSTREQVFYLDNLGKMQDVYRDLVYEELDIDIPG